MTLRTFGLAAMSFAALSGCSGSDAPKPAAQPTYTVEKLRDPATCKECHQDHYKEWSGSMHAYAAKDPLFRAMNKRGQEETHGALGNFCVNCHAPMAVAVGKLKDGGDTTIDPESIPESLSGVTCYFCHNAVDVTGTHNNPIVLANDTTMRGGISDDPLQYKAHVAAYGPLQDQSKMRSATVCGSCHDIVVPHLDIGDAGAPAAATGDGGASSEGIELERTFQEWQTSIFGSGSPKGNRTCGGCHMEQDSRGLQPIANPPEPHPPMPGGRLRHLHDFPAVDTAFSQPDFPNVEGGADIRLAQLARVQQQVDKALRVETCVDQQFSDIKISLENANAGHRFPSGASQDRRVWLEVHVSDGTKTYDSGVVAAGAEVVAAEAATTPGFQFGLLRDVTTKADGSPAHMFWDVRAVQPKTIPVSKPIDPSFPSDVTQNWTTLIFRQGQTKITNPTSVSVTVWLEPVGRDVIDDLVASGHLESDGPEAMNLPRMNLIPSRLTNSDAGANPVTLEWTHDQAYGPQGYQGGLQAATASNDNYLCMGTTKRPVPPVIPSK